VARFKPVSHEDRLSVVDHLDELRTRIIVSLLAFGVAFGVCFWQGDRVLDVFNEPLPGDKQPITFGVAEAFYTTLTTSAYAAVLIAMPVLLYQVYAFILPAFTPTERRVARPLLFMVPLLFIAGVVFCYFVVLPGAIDFLLGFNDDQFQTEVRARDYYSFVTLTTVSMGILFQVPVGVLAVTRLGLVTPEQLRKNRRYAILGCAVVAALLPTIDPVTMILETIPLVVLYELSILLAAAFGRPSQDVATPASAEGS
jgi:sec-independent protein translocase protein TatC